MPRAARPSSCFEVLATAHLNHTFKPLRNERLLFQKAYTGRGLPIEVYYNTRGHNYSTTELRNRVFEAETRKRAEN